MKIILPTSIILAAIILVIGFFIFNYYENIQIRKSCETIATNMTIADVPDNVLDKLTKEVEYEYSWSEWAWDNPNEEVKVYHDEFKKKLNKKIFDYLKPLQKSTEEKCVLENS
tara:strand:- start:18 stop:356 length:339 start_codon:yes stop_codon:yes gene_type:complete